MGDQGARAFLVVLLILWTPALLGILYAHGVALCGADIVLSVLVLFAYFLKPRGVVGIIGSLIAEAGWLNNLYVAVEYGPDDPVINLLGILVPLGALVLVRQVLEGGF